MVKFGRDVYYCPNQDCGYEKYTLKQGEKCPLCGTEMKKFGFFEVMGLIDSKTKRKQIKEKIEKEANELLITEEMTEEEIRKKIYEDMMNLAMHEAGTAWMRLGTLLSFNATEQMLGAGFKALIDQNKIIIRQNELILRTLQRIEKINTRK